MASGGYFAYPDGFRWGWTAWVGDQELGGHTLTKRAAYRKGRKAYCTLHKGETDALV